jgi:hypothetical protein
MKEVLILILLLLLQYASTAQYDNDNKNDSSKMFVAKYIYFDLENNKKDTATVQLPFNNISFTDVRFDTTFVAINWRESVPTIFNKTYNRKYNCNSGLATNLTHYFNNYYSISDQTSGKQLLCYIKKFSITLHYELLKHLNDGSELFNDVAGDFKNDIKMEIECYYKTGDYLYPATRLDTNYSIRYQKGKLLTDAVKEMLQTLMYKIEHINLDNIVKRNQYTIDQVAKRYNDRFNLPVLASDVPKKGIYKSLAEFRTNSPSIDSFIVSTDKLKDNATDVNHSDATPLVNKSAQKHNHAVFLYDANHEMINPSLIFGYCDGATFWMQYGSFFYPLVKTGNSFEFIYIYHYADLNLRTQVRYIIMPLNIETGHIN